MSYNVKIKTYDMNYVKKKGEGRKKDATKEKKQKKNPNR